MKSWEIQNNFKFQISNFKLDKLIKILLENRDLTIKREIEEYLNPSLKSITVGSLGLNKKDLDKAIERISLAIKNKEEIIIFGDYDVDGVVGCAVLWESLNILSASVMPYIPHRASEGYGLSKKGIENVLAKYPKTKLIITVDNGIVANDAVDFGNSLNLDIIVTDHHAPGKTLPKAFAIVHSTKVCGAAVGWFLSRVILDSFQDPEIPKKIRHDINEEHLGLIALASVADVMQLNGLNRTLVKIGLEQLRKTKRPGIVELLKLAGVTQEKVGVYELGHVIGPRLNAMGRIEHAMDSLRFLCTPNLTRATELANKLHLTNRERQQLTLDGVTLAKKSLKKINKLIFISDKSYELGIIGLISGRLTEEYYRPSIVVSVGEVFSKGSARSVAGFNIIEFIREFSDLLVDKGGHPMAAGFTVRTKDISKLKKLMEEKADKIIDEKILVRKLRIDCELPIEFVNLELFQRLQELSPFGYGNSEPTFLSKNLIIENMKLVGMEAKHLKIKLKDHSSNSFDAMLFSYDKSLNLNIGDNVEAVYNLVLNEWNGNKKLEMKLKDIACVSS